MNTNTKTKGKAFKSIKATVAVGTRAIREGKKVSLNSLMKEIEITDEPAKVRLETLGSKHGIKWKPTAFEHTLSPENEEKYKLKNAFVVEGEKEGKPIKFDRFQYMLFINGHREKSINVLNMSKKKFDKLVDQL